MNTTNAIRLPILATTDGMTVYTSDGRELVISHRMVGAISAGLLAEACSRNGIAQLWFATGADFALGGDRDNYGWDFEAGAHTASWAHTFKRGTNTVVELVRPILDRQSPWQTTDPRALLNGLMLYRDLLGITFHHSPAATSGDLLIGLHHGHKRNIPLDTPAMPPPALDIKCETPINWIADLASCNLMAPRRYLHSYDKNAAYLGAASGLALGAGKCEHLTRVDEADTKLPGYWLITGPVEHGIPSYVTRRNVEVDRWVTTPTVQFLRERYGSVTVKQGYVWMEHHQPLQPWYKLIRDARTTLLGIDARGVLEGTGDGVPGVKLALAAVKRSYSALLGGYLSSTMWDRSTNKPELYRPDVRHQVIATARSNLVRKALACEAAGSPPLALASIDTIYFLSDEADPVAACPAPIQLGTMLSQYKVKVSDKVTDALRAILCDASLPDSARLAALPAVPAGE